MNREEVARDLTLMLLELNSWEKGKGKLKEKRAWKGFDFDDLNDLADDGFTIDNRHAKSLAITEAGSRHAEDLFAKYGIELDPIPEPQRFFRMQLRFNFAELECMRTLLVPEHTTFEDFHTMIQACLNWMNYHLYDFQLKRDGVKHRISWPSYETGGDPHADFPFVSEKSKDTWLNSVEAYLDDFFPKVREAVYSYDYGDGWEIRVQLLNPHEKLERDTPYCPAGRGDAPPEDVGGEGGFEMFLEAIEDEDNPEFEHLTAWGESQGFERFSLGKTNRRLARWKDWQRNEEEPAPEAPITVSVIPGGKRDDGNDIEDYEAAVARRSKENAVYLKEFETFLVHSGLSRKTVNKHLDNVEFYLNDYLNYRSSASMQDGVEMLGGFLGNWFIHKCMWASRTSIKENAAGIKKFYKCMVAYGHVRQEEYQNLCDLIKEGMPDWLDELDAFDNGIFDW